MHNKSTLTIYRVLLTLLKLEIRLYFNRKLNFKIFEFKKKDS